MEIPKTDVGGQNRRQKPGPNVRRGLPDAAGSSNRWQGLFHAPKARFPFQNTYSALPANFFARVAPTPVAAPRLIKLNRVLAVQLGLDPDVLESPEGAEILSG